MDKHSRREWIRAWIAVGLKEGLPFKELAKRSGISSRTLHRWNHVFRHESQARLAPEDEERAFVQLVERIQAAPARIEVFLPGEPRIVIDGAAVIRVLARVLKAIEQ
jgi:hypothetical protein